MTYALLRINVESSVWACFRLLDAPWCSGYHYCTTSFNKAWTQVLRRFKPCSRHVGDSRWWGSLTVVPAGNKAKRLSSVNHTTTTIHHHHHYHLLVPHVVSHRQLIYFFVATGNSFKWITFTILLWLKFVAFIIAISMLLISMSLIKSYMSYY